MEIWIFSSNMRKNKNQRLLPKQDVGYVRLSDRENMLYIDVCRGFSAEYSGGGVVAVGRWWWMPAPGTGMLAWGAEQRILNLYQPKTTFMSLVCSWSKAKRNSNARKTDKTKIWFSHQISFLVAIASMVTANPLMPLRIDEPSKCSTGYLYCCDSLKNSQDPVISGVLTFLGLVVSDIVGIGTGCKWFYFIFVPNAVRVSKWGRLTPEQVRRLMLA